MSCNVQTVLRWRVKPKNRCSTVNVGVVETFLINYLCRLGSRVSERGSGTSNKWLPCQGVLSVRFICLCQRGLQWLEWGELLSVSLHVTFCSINFSVSVDRHLKLLTILRILLKYIVFVPCRTMKKLLESLKRLCFRGNKSR